MKVLQSIEAQNHFPSILKDIEAGNEIAITNKNKKIAIIVPYNKWKTNNTNNVNNTNNTKRQLGTLEGKMSVTFAEDFAIDDITLVSEKVLSTDWLLPEEDLAWQNL
jgi:antitoxin (DNA-binding transcriptional repressor) of toxin-antitoxin stability system